MIVERYLGNLHGKSLKQRDSVDITDTCHFSSSASGTSLTAVSTFSGISKSPGLLKRYSVEKMILELHKLRKVILQDGREITTEITRKQKEILESTGIKPEHVPTFLKS